jgi:hypothetical protein
MTKPPSALSYSGNGATEFGNTRDISRLTKAQELFARRKQKDDERLFNQAKDRQIQNEKTDRLRGQRLAHEAAAKDKGATSRTV